MSHDFYAKGRLKLSLSSQGQCQGFSRRTSLKLKQKPTADIVCVNSLSKARFACEEHALSLLFACEVHTRTHLYFVLNFLGTHLLGSMVAVASGKPLRCPKKTP